MSQNVLYFPTILSTKRLTLTLFNPSDEAHCQQLTDSLMLMAQGVIQAADPRKNTEEAVAYYRFSGRIESKFLGGRTPSGPALWLVRRGENAPNGDCIGIAGMIQRSYIPDQSWMIFPEHQGKGYATEAGAEWLRYFREELDLNDIMAATHPTNPKSRNVALKLGYEQREGGIMFESGTLLDFQALPGAMSPPAGLVLERFGRRVKSND
jgi:RimJ/RimL family protein N-acetyltransferase